MGARASTVRINQNRYDSATGQVIGAVKKVAGQVKQQSGLGVIDGMIRRPTAQPSPANTINQKAAAKPVSARQAREHFEKSARDLHAKTQRSYALMRRAVAKPTAAFKQSQTIAADAEPINAGRAARAKTITKHAKVRRFGSGSTSSRANSTTQPTASALRPRPAAASAAPNIARPMSSVTMGASYQQLERMLDLALHRADSHKRTLKKQMASRNLWQRLRHLPKWLQLGLIVIVLTAALTAAWYKMPVLSYRLAAYRAHLNVSAPVAPMGYKVSGATKYQNGIVTTEFKNTHTNQSFALTQQSSDQDSAALESSIAPSGQATQTTQTPSGAPIIETPTKAACVSGGTLSTITSTTGLPSPQVAEQVLAQNC